MSHTYPLGRNAKDALAKATLAARTRYEAEALVAEGLQIVALETEWLTPSAKQLETFTAQISASPAKGFVQNYEDAQDNRVLAVTYWKTAATKKTKTMAKAPKPPTLADAPPDEDHTDDLYFKAGRTRSKRKARTADPNQMDLFGTSAPARK